MSIKPEIEYINGEPYCTVRVACAIIGVSNPTLRKYDTLPNPPPYDAKLQMYNLRELGEWIRTEQIYRKGAGGSYPYKPDMRRYGETPTPVTMPGVPAPEPKEDQKVRYDRLRADKLEMEIRQKAGELILFDEVTIAISSMVSRIKTRLLSIPTSLAPIIITKKEVTEVQEIIEEKIRSALEELSGNWVDQLENDDETI